MCNQNMMLLPTDLYPLFVGVSSLPKVYVLDVIVHIQ